MKIFIKYDGSEESINDIKDLVNRANKKYEGTYKYDIHEKKVIGYPNMIISSTNLKEFEEGLPMQSSTGVPIGYYIFFNIPEDSFNSKYDFPSFSCCVEKYYLEYKEKMEI